MENLKQNRVILRQDKYEDSECFIATVVYDDIEASQIKILRKFRDNKLSNMTLGRAFIIFYYDGFGKRAAKCIKKIFPFFIPILRTSLDYLIKKLHL